MEEIIVEYRKFVDSVQQHVNDDTTKFDLIKQKSTESIKIADKIKYNNSVITHHGNSMKRHFEVIGKMTKENKDLMEQYVKLNNNM